MVTTRRGRLLQRLVGRQALVASQHQDRRRGRLSSESLHPFEARASHGATEVGDQPLSVTKVHR
jgi:hypothetical protein